MIQAGALTLVLWFGLLTLRAADGARWWLTGFELALLAVTVVIIVRRRLSIHPHLIGLLLGGAAVWGVGQVLLGTSVDPQRTLQAALGWAVNCAAFSTAMAVCGGERRVRERFLAAQAWFALAISVGAVIGLYTTGKLGPFAYKNQFAAYLEIGTGIAMARAIRDRRHTIAWLMTAAAMFAGAAAAGSRAGAILCLAELIALPAVGAWRGYISIGELARLTAVAVAGASALVMITGWETVWRRLQEPNPYALRADMLRSSVAMARERPWTGFGLGAWASAYPGYALYDDGTYVNQAHNDWAQWTAEGGVPLLLAMITVVVMLARPAVASLWGLGLMAVFVHAWVDYPFEQRPALAAFFFAMAGVLATERKNPERRERPDVAENAG